MIARRTLIAALMAVSLGACSQFPRRDANAPALHPQAGDLALQGQLSIKLQAFQNLPAKGSSLGFFFNGGPGQGQLDLMTPLGSQVARVRWTTSEAWLQTDQGDRHFTDLAELSADVLGEALPLAALMSWVQGHPDPDLPAAVVTSPQSFEQIGWHIDTTELGVGRLNAERPATTSLRGVTVRIRLDQ